MAADNPGQDTGAEGEDKTPGGAGLDDLAFQGLAGVLPAPDDVTPDPTADLRRARQQQEQQEEDAQGGPAADGDAWGLPGVWKEVYGHDVSPRLQGLIAQNGNEWTSDENTGETFFKLNNGQEVFMGERDFEGARKDFIGFQTREQQMTEQAAEAIIELALSRGWESVKLVGTEQEKALLNAKAEAAGLVVENYTPNAAAPARNHAQGGPQSELDDDAFSQLGDLGQDPNVPGGKPTQQEIIPPGEESKADGSRFTEPEAKEEDAPQPQEYVQSGPPVSAEDMVKSVSQSEETGRRSSQQDSHAVMTADLGGAERTRDFMVDMFAKTAEETKDIADGGSTATAVAISKDDVLSVANIGDSPAILILHNPETGQLVAEQVTRNHNPDDEAERQRLKEEGIDIAEPTKEGDKARLRGEDGGQLAVSRSFGDKGYEGLAQQPDLLQLDLKAAMAQGFEAYVCVSCDGLFEHDGALPQEYAEIIRDAAENGALDNVAAELTKHALDKGSKDNLTALVTKVPTGPRDSDIVMMVADGHGATGADVSSKVVDSFTAQVAAADLNQQGPQVKAEASVQADADGSRFAGDVNKKGGGDKPEAKDAKDDAPKAEGEAADGAKAEKTEKKKPRSRKKPAKKKAATKKKQPAKKPDGDTHSNIAGGDMSAEGRDRDKDKGGAKRKKTKTASRRRKAGNGKGGAPAQG